MNHSGHSSATEKRRRRNFCSCHHFTFRGWRPDSQLERARLGLTGKIHWRLRVALLVRLRARGWEVGGRCVRCARRVAGQQQRHASHRSLPLPLTWLAVGRRMVKHSVKIAHTRALPQSCADGSLLVSLSSCSAFAAPVATSFDASSALPLDNTSRAFASERQHAGGTRRQRR